jgi:iron complex outermembrane receptor protein
MYSHSALAADDAALDEVVVTGTRVADRSRLETLSPVDVLPERTLTAQGTTELASALATTAPSLNFPRPSATDGTDAVRPATLRGLSPDQALVLVDSKRRHASALVNLNGSVGRGSAAVDLNAIPLAAIDRIEVLRDGASAQYGSDAIAGVLNLHLREAREGGAASVTWGEYVTDVDTARGSRHERDGKTLTTSVWSGLPLGTTGFLTLTGEYRDRDPTSRGDYDIRAPLTQPTITSRYGDPDSKDRTFYANAGVPLNGDWQIYGWAGYQDRDVESAALPRLANNANNVAAIYPNGFLPLIATNLKDLTAAAGTRGKIGEWDADFSLVYGRNRLQYDVNHTLNATYGASSPTNFDAGALIYDQWVLNAGLVRGFEVGLAQPLNVAVGAEARREGYEIDAGEPASYNRGTVAPTLQLGAQGFPGLQPSNEVDEHRTAYSAYVDIESQITEKFLASIAGRGEHYSDFGSTLNGKLSARYDFAHAFALRGTAATGFRAPSLQQEFFTSTATVFTNGIPADTGTFPATSAVARILGAKDLEAEKSRNYSLGAVFRLASFEATVDAYQIDIRNRIVLSENLSGAAVTTLLAPYGVTQARFFINGVETRTRGIDAVLHYRLPTEAAGRFDFTVAGNFNSTDIRSVKTGTSSLPGVVLFSRQNQFRYEEGTPKSKVVLSSDWTYPVSLGALSATVKGTRYGKVVAPGTATDGSLDLDIDPAWVVDLELRLDVHEHWSVGLGADNALDKYPTQNPVALNSTGAVGFSQFSPFGFNGRFLYVRGGYKW